MRDARAADLSEGSARLNLPTTLVSSAIGFAATLWIRRMRIIMLVRVAQKARPLETVHSSMPVKIKRRSHRHLRRHRRMQMNQLVATGNQKE
jgi:hypothetical protein